MRGAIGRRHTSSSPRGYGELSTSAAKVLPALPRAEAPHSRARSRECRSARRGRAAAGRERHVAGRERDVARETHREFWQLLEAPLVRSNVASTAPEANAEWASASSTPTWSAAWPSRVPSKAGRQPRSSLCSRCAPVREVRRSSPHPHRGSTSAASGGRDSGGTEQRDRVAALRGPLPGLRTPLLARVARRRANGRIRSPLAGNDGVLHWNALAVASRDRARGRRPLW